MYQNETEAQFAANGLDLPHQGRPRPGRLHGHEIADLGHAVAGEKAGQQNIRVRQVELFLARFSHQRCNLKSAALLTIQQRGENGWGIE